MTPLHIAIYVILTIIYITLFAFIFMIPISTGGGMGHAYPYEIVAFQMTEAPLGFKLMTAGAALLALSMPFLLGQGIMYFV